MSTGIVSHVKVLCDHVEDVSSLEAWKRSFIKEGMTEQQKALAVWETVVKFRHQARPPDEFADNSGNVHDPIRTFNVYGYGQCCCASANIEALARYAGLEARGWGITNHSVPEVKIDGRWAMLDASLINYFPKPDGSIAGVEEIHKGINDWLAVHPEFQGLMDHHHYYPFMAGGGWRNGPPILAGSPFFDENGWAPARTHSWGDAMHEFGGAKNFVYDYGIAVGYEVNIQLRAGEKLVRHWGNKGLHVNQAEKPALNMLAASPEFAGGDMGYAVKFGDKTRGRLGNGTVEYDLPLTDGTFRGGMLTVENLACASDDGCGPALHLKDPAKPGLLIFRMPTSYVYLTGQLTFSGVVGGGGSIVVSFSDNNGLDWRPIGVFTHTGPQTLDLKPLVYRRCDYRLRFELNGNGTGLESVKLVHDIQHSQRVLPILDQGENRLRFSAGPREGTITVQGKIQESDPRVPEKKNLLFSEFHPVLENIAGPSLTVQGTLGRVSVPVQTPGDLTRLRIGIHCRARKAEDAWTIEASFDQGKTFVRMATLGGPYKAFCTQVIFDRVPAGVRSALVRCTGTQHLDAEEERQRLAGIDMAAESRILDLRIDADYTEQHGGFAPVKIIYAYEENGTGKTHIHVARSPDETYTIHCDQKPVMKSITLQLAEP